MQAKTTLLLVGKDRTGRLLQDQIKKSGQSDKLIICGFVERYDMSSFWKQADLNILTSIKEGFGLSIIEGFVYGVPCITFADLDAVPNLYHKNAMFLVNERKVEHLAQGIQSALLTSWDHEWIKNYSQQFSLQKMADETRKLYSSLHFLF